MSITINAREDFYDAPDYFMEWYDKVKGYLPRYKETEYSTFNEYRERLERWIKIERPDIVMLAAAVSDYGVENPVDGKIRSNDLLTIKLVQFPKIIHLIKTWHPTCKLVGFKLLVDSKDYQLIDAAKRSIAENGCDMIVANDLSDIKEGKHKIHLVFPKTDTLFYETDPTDSNFLARKVAEQTLSL
jgi:phosphopantothenate-cysteine ligase